MRKRSWWLVGLLVTLIILLVVASLLLLRGRRLERVVTVAQPGATPYIIQLPKQIPNSPISKRVYEGESTALYIMHGSFVSPLEERSYTAVGTFQLRGDPERRTFVVSLGTTERKLLLGVFKGSFATDSSWRWKSFDEVLPLLTPGREVELQFNVSLDPKSNFFEANRQLEQRLDSINQEYGVGTYTRDVPDLSWLAVHAVGVVE